MFKLNEELNELILKIIIPTIAGLSIKIGIMIRNRDASTIKVGAGLLTGVGAAVSFGHIFIEQLPYHYASAGIAVTVMLSERLSVWIIEKFDLEQLLERIVTNIADKIKKK